MMRKYPLYIISFILLVIIVLAIPGKDSFELDASEILDLVGENEYVISRDQFASLRNQGNVPVFDLRNPDEFLNSPLPGAVNLPFDELNMQSIRKSLAGNGIKILYAGETSTACNAWIFLTQMGYKDLLVLDRD